MSLSRQVDRFLKKQAKLNEKSEKIIDVFIEKHAKPEICSVCEYVMACGAPKHAELIKEFKNHYEQNILTVEDIKSYLDLCKIHKDGMKAPKTQNTREE